MVFFKCVIGIALLCLKCGVNISGLREYMELCIDGEKVWITAEGFGNDDILSGKVKYYSNLTPDTDEN